MTKYVIDTNILSELTKPEADQGVIDWLMDNTGNLRVATPSIYELLFGIKRMAHGARRMQLEYMIEGYLADPDLEALSFDSKAARVAAQMRADAVSAGRTPPAMDLLIAAIAQSNNCTVATRNVKDFQTLGVPTLNPFEYVSPVLERLRKKEEEERAR